MKIKISLLGIALMAAINLPAQQFISKAVIEYEVKSNIQKSMGNNMWDEMMKDNLPTFKDIPGVKVFEKTWLPLITSTDLL